MGEKASIAVTKETPAFYEDDETGFIVANPSGLLATETIFPLFKKQDWWPAGWAVKAEEIKAGC